MTDIVLNWSLGIDNVSDKTGILRGAVADAVNVTIDRGASVQRRRGRVSVLAQTDCHSIWTSDARAESFGVVSGSLCKINMPWHATALYTLASSAPLSYDDLNGDVVASSRDETVLIAPDLSVRRLGLETPPPPGVTASTSGGLAAGTYGFAVAFLRGSEEGATSRTAFITVAESGGARLSLPSPGESLATAIRIYRTGQDDDILRRCSDAPAGGSWLVGAGQRGRETKGQYLDRMIPGDFVRYWHGRLWTVRHNVIYFSEPLWYGVYAPRYRHIQLAKRIRLFEPVEGGIFVGSADGVFFLSGSGPKDFNVRKTGGKAPFVNSGRRVAASWLGEDASGEYVATWLSENGYVVGNGDGSIREPQSKRVRIGPVTNAASVVYDRLITTVVQ